MLYYPLPFLAVSIYFISYKINRRSERVQAKLSEITTISQESISGIKLIKAFNNQKNILKNLWIVAKTIYKPSN